MIQYSIPSDAQRNKPCVLLGASPRLLVQRTERELVHEWESQVVPFNETQNDGNIPREGHTSNGTDVQIATITETDLILMIMDK